MNNKIMTRNKNNLPINFCTTGNFLNLSKIKFIPIDKSLKVSKKKKSKNNSFSHLSDTIPKKEINKDELIKQLKERITFLEDKIKILEKEIEKNKKERKKWNNKTLILRMNNLNKALNQMNKITTIPLDKNLLKTKLNKKKKTFELLDMKKVIKKYRSNSFNFNIMELNMSKMSKHNSKNNSISSINNSICNYYTNNNSSASSALKTKKKSINLINKANIMGSIHNLLYCLSSKSSNSKISSSIDHKKRKNFGEVEKKVAILGGRKINAINGIPKKGRKNFNTSPIMMMSSTNYSNNVSNSFKDEKNIKKNSPKKVFNNSSFCEKNSNNEIKNKLENIQNRTKNLLKLYYSISLDKNGINKFNIIINKEKMFANFSHYIKISKLEKQKKD